MANMCMKEELGIPNHQRNVSHLTLIGQLLPKQREIVSVG